MNNNKNKQIPAESDKLTEELIESGMLPEGSKRVNSFRETLYRLSPEEVQRSVDGIKRESFLSMKSKERILEFNKDRKVSFDNECHHARIPLELVKTVKKEGLDTSKVHWEGAWKDKGRVFVVLAFGEDEDSEDYVMFGSRNS